MKIRLILFLLLFTNCNCFAIDFGSVLLGKENNYFGQRADNGKAKNGTGILKIEKGGVYIGDLNRNKYNGRGMLIAGDGTISNTPGAFVYVGSWVQGKKNGRGTCYSTNGDIIYNGKFKDDVPCDKFPQDSTDIYSYFSMIEDISGNIYIGEVTVGSPNGFGITINIDGQYIIGNNSNGQNIGITAIINGPDNWTIVNYKDNVLTEINSSEAYNARREQFATAKKKIMSDLWDGLSDIAFGLTQVASETINFKDSDSSRNNANIAYEANKFNAKQSYSKKVSTTKKGNDCGTAWLSDSRIYSNYESQLIRGGLSATEILSIRANMRNIRKNGIKGAALYLNHHKNKQFNIIRFNSSKIFINIYPIIQLKKSAKLLSE